MQERGFTETLSAQAEYTAQANAVQQAVQLGSVSFSAVLDMGLLEKAAKTLKSLGAGVDLIQSAAATVSNVSEALVLLHFSESYEQKLSLLEAIRDNTDDKHLKEAAERSSARRRWSSPTTWSSSAKRPSAITRTSR